MIHNYDEWQTFAINEERREREALAAFYAHEEPPRLTLRQKLAITFFAFLVAGLGVCWGLSKLADALLPL